MKKLFENNYKLKSSNSLIYAKNSYNINTLFYINLLLIVGIY